MASDPTSFYWYDLETSGLRPTSDRITQFAGQRTDLELNPIGEPYVTYIKLPPYVLPDPEAVLITGVHPKRLQEEGIDEWQAIQRIHACMSKPGTCTLGYNNLNFDDEFIRYTLFRNLFPPYRREFEQGNSRFDLFPVLLAAAAMRPAKIKWPLDNENRISVSLASLSRANGIDAGGAHDALKDVRMSIALARVVKRAQPQLWSYLLNSRSKQATERTLEDGSRFYLYINSTFGAKRCFAAPVRVLATHPEIKTRILVADLSADLSSLNSATPEELNEARFLSNEEARAQGRTRLGLYEVPLNKCPVIVGVDRLTTEMAQRFQVDVDQVERNLTFLARLGHQRVEKLVHTMLKMANRDITSHIERDASERLYDDFIGRRDERLCEVIHSAIDQGLALPKESFKDERLQELADRLSYELRPREFSHLAQKYQKFIQHMLRRDHSGVSARRATIAELRKSELSASQQEILDHVSAYIEEAAATYDV